MHKLARLLVPVLLAALAMPATATTKQVAKQTHGKPTQVRKTNGAQKPATVQKADRAQKPATVQKTAAPVSAGASAKQGCTPAEVCLTPDECLALYLLNEERRDHHLPQLKLDETLVKVARSHSKDMADRGYFSHFEPATQRDPVDRYTDAIGRRPTEVIGENLGMADEPMMGLIHDSLMKSPAHRENILDHEYVRVGVGIYETRDGRTWLTEMFAGQAPPERAPEARQSAKQN